MGVRGTWKIHCGLNFLGRELIKEKTSFQYLFTLVLRLKKNIEVSNLRVGGVSESS